MNDVLMQSRAVGATQLRDANRRRAKLWHPTPESEWPPRRWFKAFLGEVGEAADADKKLDRISGGAAHIGGTAGQLFDALGYEIADALIYLDLLAESVGVRAEFLWNYDYPPAETSQYESSDDIFCDLSISMGHLGFALRFSHGPASPSRQRYIRECQKYLLILAQFHGHDVSHFMREKFNATSAKYNFAVRL